MPTTFHKWRGKAAWAQIFENNWDREYGNSSIHVALDDESLEDFKQSGCQVRPVKKPAVGTDNEVRFRRSYENEQFPERGGVPKVTLEDGTPYEGPIGNGSTVEVTVVLYDTRRGKGHRLEEVKVLELVEYNPDQPEKKENNASEPNSNQATPF